MFWIFFRGWLRESAAGSRSGAVQDKVPRNLKSCDKLGQNLDQRILTEMCLFIHGLSNHAGDLHKIISAAKSESYWRWKRGRAPDPSDPLANEILVYFIMSGFRLVASVGVGFIGLSVVRRLRRS